MFRYTNTKRAILYHNNHIYTGDLIRRSEAINGSPFAQGTIPAASEHIRVGGATGHPRRFRRLAVVVVAHLQSLVPAQDDLQRENLAAISEFHLAPPTDSSRHAMHHRRMGCDTLRKDLRKFSDKKAYRNGLMQLLL